MFMLRSTLRGVAALLAVCAIAGPAFAQRPEPFPRPGESTKPAAPAGATQAPATPPPSSVTPEVSGDPTEASLGLPIYPAAQFLTSYDTNAAFSEIVTFYRTRLKQRGELVFDEPPVHMFEVGRFREETMAFPPGVTVKDYTWGGSLGYLNPKRGAEPARFKTIIQIVPAQPGASR
jgi:hypothetical protein